jgi:hypothetical protein
VRTMMIEHNNNCVVGNDRREEEHLNMLYMRT